MMHPQLPAAQRLLTALRALEQDAEQLYDAAWEAEQASRAIVDSSTTALVSDLLDDLSAVKRQAEALVQWIADQPQVTGILLDTGEGEHA